MPDSSYNTSLLRCIFVTHSTIEYFYDFMKKNISPDIEINVSFSDDTNTKYDNYDEIKNIPNVKSRYINTISISGHDYDNSIYSTIEFMGNNNYKNINIRIRAQEDKLLYMKRFFDEKIEEITQWYSVLIYFYKRFEYLIYGIKTVILFISFTMGIIIQKLQIELTDSQSLIIATLPVALLILNYFLNKIARLYFPFTVFAFGRIYDDYRASKKRIAQIIGFLFTVLIGGMWFLIDKYF